MNAFPANSLDELRSPKLAARKGTNWYRYYAGFSTEFVSDICDLFELRTNQRVLDPWMGSGTTLSVAARRGSFVSGLDLNPVMSVIAKGRLLAEDTLSSVEPLLSEITKHWTPSEISESDMLSSWFTWDTSRLVRGLAHRINSVLVLDQPDPVQKAEKMSSLAAFFYVALFETVTGSLKAYGSRNPTWIKRGSPGSGRVALTKDEINDSFHESVRLKLRYIESMGPVATTIRNMSKAAIGDSRLLPFESASCDMVITSPPYLTRLDYVIGHLPELAALGFSSENIRDLRKRMIGTPTIHRAINAEEHLGPDCEELLETVRHHNSYAAENYYEPIYRQYFQGMAASIKEIGRVCKSHSKVALVIQDSWFKNVHIDLAKMLRGMAELQGWMFIGQKDFQNSRSMAQLNSKAHELARTTKPIESVLLLESGTSFAKFE